MGYIHGRRQRENSTNIYQKIQKEITMCLTLKPQSQLHPNTLTEQRAKNMQMNKYILSLIKKLKDQRENHQRDSTPNVAHKYTYRREIIEIERSYKYLYHTLINGWSVL